jgi:hypothetical protein
VLAELLEARCIVAAADHGRSGDAPAVSVRSDDADLFQPSDPPRRVGWLSSEAPHPRLTGFDRLFGNCERPLFHGMFALGERPLHVRVGDAPDFWYQANDHAVGLRPANAPSALGPTLDAAMEDRCDVAGVVESSPGHEEREGALDVEPTRIGLTEGSQQRPVSPARPQGGKLAGRQPATLEECVPAVGLSGFGDGLVLGTQAGDALGFALGAASHVVRRQVCALIA